MPSQSFQLNIFSNFVESAPVLKKPDLFISHSMVERESKTCSGFTITQIFGELLTRAERSVAVFWTSHCICSPAIPDIHFIPRSESATLRTEMNRHVLYYERKIVIYHMMKG